MPSPGENPVGWSTAVRRERKPLRGALLMFSFLNSQAVHVHSGEMEAQAKLKTLCFLLRGNASINRLALTKVRMLNTSGPLTVGFDIA